MTISMLLLILSSVFLLQFGNTSLLPRSVFKLILVNGTVYLKSNVKNELKLPFFSPESSQADARTPVKNGDLTCHKPNYGKEMCVYRQRNIESCNANQALLRVYMYDMPSEFHFGLLGWKGKSNQVWSEVNNPTRVPAYPGGLNLQHSMEYWLTLDLLSSNAPSVVRPCAAIRVTNSSEADIVFVPFFASLSYNRHSKLRGKEKVSVNKLLQNKLVKFLTAQNEWKLFWGKDHLIVAHHPNSMLDATRKLGSAMFVLADFRRYPAEIANIEKDVIAPYRHVVMTIPSADSAPFEKRPILVFFQGAIYRKDYFEIFKTIFIEETDWLLGKDRVGAVGSRIGPRILRRLDDYRKYILNQIEQHYLPAQVVIAELSEKSFPCALGFISYRQGTQ